MFFFDHDVIFAKRRAFQYQELWFSNLTKLFVEKGVAHNSSSGWLKKVLTFKILQK